ncbi:histidine triad nucleotide-binding protein [Magnetofaba australis]|uniref:Putative histidine triad (HIT) protein n=1 Tax=Magnetofaba australis IT-1 TaxID=1434232 RepID=A0A1Y2K246_9PROT|nr:histidine triad nucleotide-binding protein [Magnetofaba australis]OSM02032.1 putative histidine triad (HIT) protein [Magnetofaba australis IT-1]
MSDDCLFCKIAAGQIPCNRVYEDDQVLAFHDINPQAPVHVLVIPKAHIATLDDVGEAQREIMGVVMERAAHVARELGVAEAGYRTIINTREHGGQEVYHIHAHILAGKRIGPMTVR